ncbi:MAG: alpha/beta fold hydrolase [SAR324 cluster bacterium]|nr:alpha/beta fold hydrolase [SAR324 cluster bacterium]
MEKAWLSMVNLIERSLDSGSMKRVDKTPFDIIHEEDLLSVRHYPALTRESVTIANQTIPVLNKVHRVPLVLIPPLAVGAFIFDLYPQRSLVSYYLAQGFDVYLINWGNPDRDHSHLSFETYLLDWMPKAIQHIREYSGKQELSLFGYCMGGLFSLIYTAVHEDAAIRNIVTVASPIDMHQMGAAGKVFTMTYQPAHRLARAFNFKLINVNPKYLHISGKLGTIGFWLTNPIGNFTSFWDFILHLWDRDYLISHDSMGHWFNNMVDYPGATMKSIVVHMWIENQLAQGKMTVGEKEANLKQIHASLLSFAGNDDKIVSLKSSRKIMDVITAEDKEFRVVPGGHAGVFAGRKAVDYVWGASAEWLARRSN